MDSSQKLRCREEFHQSLTRLGFSIGTLVILGSFLFFNRGTDQGTLPVGVATVMVHSFFSIFWHQFIKRRPTQGPNRIYVTLFMDITATSLAFFFAARFGAFFYPIFLWILVGYGLRYGKKPMLTAILLAIMEFGSVINFHPYWQANQLTGLGMLFGIIALPSFFLTVMRRLKSLNAKLERELVRSQAAEKAKGDFLANMSHEIRTPLNGVLGMANIIDSGCIDEENREHLAVLRKSAQSLLEIINDILDFSKITSGDMTIESVPLDLKDVLAEVRQILQPSAAAKNLDLHLDYPAGCRTTFLGDPTRIRQIVMNLAANAVKFTTEGSVSIQVRTEELNPSAHEVQIDVVDTGVGIPQDRLDNIFEQFEQADSSTTRNFGGTGLGLAISKQLARQMGGDITVQSRLGQGSIFRTVLLLLPSEIQLQRTVSRTDLPCFDLKILVAEDNKVNQRVIRKLLKKVGIEAVVVDNGQLALEALDNQEFDLIFMDVRMPVMDGLEAARRIRARDDVVAGIPIVALTADADHQSAQRCRDAGMDLHLGKPVILEEAIQALDSLCVRAEA